MGTRLLHELSSSALTGNQPVKNNNQECAQFASAFGVAYVIHPMFVLCYAGGGTLLCALFLSRDGDASAGHPGDVLDTDIRQSVRTRDGISNQKPSFTSTFTLPSRLKRKVLAMVRQKLKDGFDRKELTDIHFNVKTCGPQSR
jgi:hypothetical protein